MSTLTFLGAAGTVTGSKYLVSCGSSRVFVDCGVYQGLKELRERNWSDLPVDPSSLDAVVLTHAHVDHCGFLPRLTSHGFDGPVYATPRTIQLAGIVLPDSGHLFEEEAAYANRKGYSRHDPALPLFTRDDAVAALQQLRPLDFGVEREIAPNISARLSRAGHILGAASVHLTLADCDRGLVVSGDLGRDSHPFLVAPDPPHDSDHILIESTYGDRRHDDSDAQAVLAVVINETLARGGSIFIPAFAVDRTEVIIHHLAELKAANKIPRDLPMFVDSPMALGALDVYRGAIADGDADIRADMRGTHPFELPNLHEVRDVEGSKALNQPAQPCVVVSAAGMASGGRIVHHLAGALPERRNTVLLVGYQAAGTRGRRLLEGATELKMFGRYVPVRARIVEMPQFSVHADSRELVEWARRAPTKPQVAYVVHGEPSAAEALASSLRSALGWTAVVPRLGERVRLD
jgi:metallo-beta-lactamase family protein